MIDTVTFWAVFMRIPEDAGLVNIDQPSFPIGKRKNIKV